MNISQSIRIMGILNTTPDSFYDGGRYFAADEALRRAEQMIEEGVDIIDVGGESTRPGAAAISAQEELDRVCPVVSKLAEMGVTISVDTRRAVVAAEVLTLGAHMINDISGLDDPDMPQVVARAGADVVIMHMRGNPATMQLDTRYNDLEGEVLSKLRLGVNKAREAGIKDRNIILDPGIGFGKSLEDNYRLLHAVPEFCALGFPVLVGLSRKSLIGGLYQKDVDRLPGTIALNVLACNAGASIVRVHDVRAHRLALDALEMYQRVS